MHALRPGTRLTEDPEVRGAWLLEVGGAAQSCVDPADPTNLVFDYARRIGDALDLHAEPGLPLRVVHVGGAAMTLPRYLVATRPRSSQIVLEPDAQLTDFVRSHLPLPPRNGVRVRPVDGLTGVSAMPDDYADVVVVDAYAGDRVPPELTTTSFLSQVHRVLRADGTVLMNLADQAPLGYLRRSVAGVRELFGDVIVSGEPAVLRGRRFGNLLVLGSRGRLPVAALTRRAAGSAFPYRVTHGEALTRLVGSARPFTAEDSASSPAPPVGF